MTNISTHRLLFTALAILSILSASAIQAAAQSGSFTPDLTVAGLRLGDRSSGKAFLETYQPRIVEERPTYYFYDKYASTVMKVTTASFDDPYFVTEVEVFAIDNNYRNRHFYLEKVRYFDTESEIFIGTRQSKQGVKMTLILGSPVPLGMKSNNLKDILRKKGEPTQRNRSGKEETLDYKLYAVNVGDKDPDKYSYAARYQFYENRLNRFSMKLLPK